MAGLNMFAEMGIYIIDFSLKGAAIEAISLVESVCPYPTLHPHFAKCTNGTILVSLHYHPDWPGDILYHKVNVTCANGQGVDLLAEPNRLLPNGIFDNPSLVKRESHRVLCECPHICSRKRIISWHDLPVFDISAIITLQPGSVRRPRNHIPKCFRHVGDFMAQ